MNSRCLVCTLPYAGMFSLVLAFFLAKVGHHATEASTTMLYRDFLRGSLPQITYNLGIPLKKTRYSLPLSLKALLLKLQEKRLMNKGNTDVF